MKFRVTLTADHPGVGPEELGMTQEEFDSAPKNILATYEIDAPSKMDAEIRAIIRCQDDPDVSREFIDIFIKECIETSK